MPYYAYHIPNEKEIKKWKSPKILIFQGFIEYYLSVTATSAVFIKKRINTRYKEYLISGLYRNYTFSIIAKNIKNIKRLS